MLEYGKFALSPEYAVADKLPEVNRPCYVRGGICHSYAMYCEDGQWHWLFEGKPLEKVPYQVTHYRYVEER